MNCDLESNRVEELDQLLDLLKPKILQFVLDADNSHLNTLGNYVPPKELKQYLKPFENLQDSITKDELSDLIDNILKYSVNTWNPGFLDKLYASNNPIGVISDLILSVLNTNSHVYTVSPVLSILENFIGKKYAQLFFKSDNCGGLTFSGGSWSNITSLQMARALKFPETKVHGNIKKFAIYTSQHCHYSVEKAGILLGFGTEAVFKVKVDPEGVMDVDDLEQVITESISNGYTPLYINATAGTTVFGSFDPFKAIAQVAQKYNIWFHIDGSWGGNVVFSAQQRSKLDGCEFADSITVNPHKMLGVPTTCSFLLVPNVKNFQKSMSLGAPYLFHGRENDEENFDLADGTMGCGRRADAFKFYMAWKYYGTKGLEKRINHAYKIVDYFVSKASKTPGFEIVHKPACLQVCFFYRPANLSSVSYTEITRSISRQLHTQGKYLVDFSPHPEGRGEFFRVVFNSPILTDKVVDDLIEQIVKAGNAT